MRVDFKHIHIIAGVLTITLFILITLAIGINNNYVVKAEEQKQQDEQTEIKNQEINDRKPEVQVQEQPKHKTSGYPQTLTKRGGVYIHNGMRETWYSSRVLRHKCTSQWWLDDDGFYHDEWGYFVVSCNYADHMYGDVFETSKGLSRVLDTGCPKGTIDFYVNW